MVTSGQGITAWSTIDTEWQLLNHLFAKLHGRDSRDWPKWLKQRAHKIGHKIQFSDHHLIFNQ